MKGNPVIAALGEVLWDVFPDGAHFGGAPANFASHAASLGAEAWMVSAVGDDDLGRRAHDVLARHGVKTERVAIDPAHPTGQVLVTIDPAGVPTYQIAEDTAWGHIAWSDSLLPLASRCDAVCFGSLGQRSEESRATIRHFLRSTRPGALRVFDVNLRQHFYSREVIEESLHHASVLKLNDDELPILAQFFEIFGDTDRELLGQLTARFDLSLIALTRGPRGSILHAGGEFDECPAPPTDIVDTVGAGDAFTAVLVMGFLRELPLAEINRHANAVAAYVCSQPGATPELPRELRFPKAD
jgi:fructokinase